MTVETNSGLIDVEKNINEIPKEVVIDECIRLAKKFSNEKAYKYVNAKADILYDL